MAKKSKREGPRIVPLGAPTVVVDNVSLTYHAEVEDPPAGISRPKRLLHNVFQVPYQQQVPAVRNVSLVAREGEAIGLIGSNGAGKSSLMRIIAGLDRPDEGLVLASAEPRLQAVGAALIPALPGRQNIRLGTLATGATPEMVDEVTPEIIELAGLGEAIDRPMNTYSSGMRARLIFAINAFSHAEILLIDEALATGDATFARKSREAMERIRGAAGTTFLISHYTSSIRRMCHRAIWMHHGTIVADGDATDVSALYASWGKLMANDKQEEAADLMEQAKVDFAPALTSIEYTRSSRHLRFSRPRAPTTPKCV